MNHVGVPLSSSVKTTMRFSGVTQQHPIAHLPAGLRVSQPKLLLRPYAGKRDLRTATAYDGKWVSLLDLSRHHYRQQAFARQNPDWLVSDSGRLTDKPEVSCCNQAIILIESWPTGSMSVMGKLRQLSCHSHSSTVHPWQELVEGQRPHLLNEYFQCHV